jgi:cysteine desulfurase family protein
LAGLLGVANPERIVLTGNATEALNLAIGGLVKPGDHVVLTDLEHNAVGRPLWRLQTTRGLRISVIPSNPEGFVDPAAVGQAIRRETRLVCCTHVNNVLGTIQPIEEIAEVASRRQVPLLVDASQSAGLLPIDVDAMGIDLLAFTGHKALLGPPGTGGLYVREGLCIEPLKFGGTGVHSESLVHPDSMPEGFEAGTANALGIAGLGAAVGYVTSRGIESIRAHEMSLNELFMESVRAIPGVTVYGPSSTARKVGITSLNLEGLDPIDVGRLLDRRFGVLVRTGLHCSALTHTKLRTQNRGAIRFSFGHSSTQDEVACALDALHQIAATIYEEAK